MSYKKRKKILATFSDELKKRTGFSSVFIVKIVKYLRDNLEEITIRSDKFLFDKFFYHTFIQQVVHGEMNAKNNSFYYMNFQHLVYHDLIHVSSSLFPKGLTKKSVNPLPLYLVSNDINYIDEWITERKRVLYELEKNNKDFLYVYLRDFHLKNLSDNDLSEITYKNLIVIPEKDEIVLYKECSTLITRSKMYRLITIDKYAGKVLKNLIVPNKDTLVFEEFTRHKGFADNFRKNSLNSMKITTIKNVKYIFFATQSSQLEVSMERNYVSTVELTISELLTLYPTCDISNEILLAEKERIEDTFIKRKTLDQSPELINSQDYTDLMDFRCLSFLRRSSSYTEAEIDLSMHEITRYMVIHDNLHASLIYSYIIYLLNRLKNKKIKLSTFNNYFYILNKYIFRRFENLYDIQETEMTQVLNEIYILKFESQKTSIGILRRFFLYHEIKNNFKVDFNRVHYPKSMIFDFEIDMILDEVENRGRKNKQTKFNILQMQMMVILGYYGGLRRNEIRSRRIKDFIFTDGHNIYYQTDKMISLSEINFYVDINNLGFQKLEGKFLKSSNAKRRVKFVLNSEKHFNIIQKFIELRRCGSTDRDALLFISQRKNGQYSKKPIDEKIFDTINNIIKDITKRYCTFHSLRHSFATYFTKKIIIEKNKYDDAFELNIQCGHSTLGITFNRYVHWNLISFL